MDIRFRYGEKIVNSYCLHKQVPGVKQMDESVGDDSAEKMDRMGCRLIPMWRELPSGWMQLQAALEPSQVQVSGVS
jgi:hypothetical protein